MSVHATNLNRLTIDKQLSVLDIDSAETYLLRHLLNNGTISLLQLQTEGIEVRMLHTPQLRIGHFHLHAVELTVASLRVPFVHACRLVLEVKDFLCCDSIATNRTGPIVEGCYEVITIAGFPLINGELGVYLKHTIH